MIKRIDEQWNNIVDEFARLHPLIAEKVIDWYPSGQLELTVRTDEGDKYAYDFIEKKIRFLGNIYAEQDEMSSIDELEWRRKFASVLDAKMRRVCISQSALSELTGISMVSISKYINGKATPSTYNLSKIARALHCSTHELTELY